MGNIGLLLYGEMPQIEMDINIFEQVPVHIRALCGNGAKQLTYNRPFESVSGSCYFIPDVVNLSSESEYEGFNASLMDMKTGGCRFQNRERTCNGTGKSTNLHLELENHLSLEDIFPKNLNVRRNKCFKLPELQEVDNYSDETCVNLQTQTVFNSKEIKQEYSVKQVLEPYHLQEAELSITHPQTATLSGKTLFARLQQLFNHFHQWAKLSVTHPQTASLSDKTLFARLQQLISHLLQRDLDGNGINMYLQLTFSLVCWKLPFWISCSKNADCRKFDTAKAISKNTVKASYQSTSDTLQDEIASAQNSSHYSEQDRGESDTFLSLMDGKEKFSYDQKKKKGGYQQGRSGCERGWYYFRLLVILPLFLPAMGGTSQCVDGQVQMNKSALLMFPFDSSIIFNQKETIAHVDHCPFNTTICDPVIELKLEGNSTIPTSNRSGYQLVNSTAGGIFVLITSVRPEHAGRYRFTIFGEPSFTPCSLTIIDNDKCVEGAHSCAHNCTSQGEGPMCFCFPGYVLNEDNKTCSESTADIAQSTADIPQSTADIAQNYNHIVPIVLGAAVFMMTLIFIAVYFFYPKKFDRFCKATASTSEKCSKEEAQHLQASNGHIA